MKDMRKTKKQLIEELDEMRGRVERLREVELIHDRMEEALQASEEHQRALLGQMVDLVEITNELVMAKTVDMLCLRAIELGCDRLGFERIGIWFRSDKEDVVRGTFDVDEKGRISDEREISYRVKPNSVEGRILLSREPLVLEAEAPILNARGLVIGQGAQVCAAIWDGRRVIGYIIMDNWLSKEPITEDRCELLRLYGSTIGCVYALKKALEDRERLIIELREALDKIQQLEGLVPICSACKKVRRDEGYWQIIEDFISSHSAAEFSHSICPECAKQIYGEF
ncbi:GAF domain-containing protein [Candidatus Sumerlaeota bacterium]